MIYQVNSPITKKFTAHGSHINLLFNHKTTKKSYTHYRELRTKLNFTAEHQRKTKNMLSVCHISHAQYILHVTLNTDMHICMDRRLRNPLIADLQWAAITGISSRHCSLLSQANPSVYARQHTTSNKQSNYSTTST